MNKGTKCAIYVRVSRDDQHCENQLLILREWAKAQGVEVFQEYVDHGVSGTKKSRPALDRMIADARRRYFKAILVWRFDRLGRSVAHIASLAEELKAVGVDLLSHKESLDTTTPMGKAFFDFAAMFAEMERDAISERTKLGLDRARAEGRVGGRKKIALDAQKIQTMRGKGMSHTAIGEALGCSRETIRKEIQNA
jgi:DNA invertase Pin-like site-specific DNA recombinase